MFSSRLTPQRLFWLLATVLLWGTLFTLWLQSSEAQSPLPAAERARAAVAEPPLEYAPGLVIVKLKPGIRLAAQRGMTTASVAVDSGSAGLDQTLRALGVSGAEPVFPANTAHGRQAAVADSPLTRIYRLHLAPTADVAAAVDLLRANDAVEYAEPDYLARAVLIPNDPEWGNQWALAKINAHAAWDITQGVSTTIIALVDSGLDWAHPDLAGRLWHNDDAPGNGVDDDQNGQIDDVNGWNFVTASNIITDANGHGTQVAGVAGAAGNNGLGVAGLCWHCPLMPVVAMQANGVANYSTIANAVVYAAANGAAVINLSLGGYADSSLLREAIREAATTALIVAAAGNDDSAAPFYPAAYPDVLAVAATGATDQKTIFSNYGPWVDLAAPGNMIQTTTLGGYSAPSGTSVAAPLAAGVAGLLKSLHPDWSPALIAWQILNTAAPLDGVNPTYQGKLGHGRLDAGAALTQPPQARIQVEGYTVDGQSNGRPAPGQSFPLVLTVRNIWMPGQSLTGTLTSADPYVTIADNHGLFGDIDPGATGENSSDPFGVSLQPDTPYNRTLPLTLTLTGANGYTTMVPFTLQVRTAVETLGNTQYTQNTTWTSDKIYILNGTVIVGQGITLTIQPGTVVKGNPGKFIRVDGVLAAQGTVQSPIIFTTNAANHDKWGGLRFADSAVSASFDVDGNYVAGSILRYVAISHAATGVNLGTSAPYIADSTFHHNEVALQSNGNAPRLARNDFSENVTAIALMGGNPVITGNHFTRNRNGTMGSAIDGSGSPQVLGNTFTDEQGYFIIRLTGSGNPMMVGNLLLRDNRIVNNVGGLWLSGMQTTTIEGNLIAESRPFCFTPPCGSTGVAALALDLQPSGGAVVRNNTIINNSGAGLWLRGAGASAATITNNNLFGNRDYDIDLPSGSPGTQNFTINAVNNFWKVDAAAIAGRIRDCTFDENGCGSSSSTLGKVQYDPPLSEPSQNAPAFIRRATMNPDTVGLNQIGIMTLDFSRPMITNTNPSATFHDARRGTQERMGSSADAMAQDALGRMWFGGSNGARMFDGRKWFTYTMSNSGIASNQIDTIYGAANGDVWFANVLPSVPQHIAPLSRLRGSTWVTYTVVQGIQFGSIRAISEDSTSALWFADGDQGVIRYDGVSWRRHTTTDGLGHNTVRSITADSDGNTWFIVGNNNNINGNAITQFDGVTWQTYSGATGLPSNSYFGPIFADNQNRIWFGIEHIPIPSGPVGGEWVGMFNNGVWTFFSHAETGGHLNCPSRAFAEASDGSTWMLACDRLVGFKDGAWSSIVGLSNTRPPLVLDKYDNFWLNMNNLYVLWHGIDYPFDAGQWLSPTRYQSSYNFTALVPQGVYAVDVHGAIGQDGMEAVVGVADTFRVDFGTAANPAPPFAPVVEAANDGTLTTISAHWHTDTPDVDQYRYAIGTTPGARNIIGWTYLTAKSITRTDLALTQGQPYYVSVQARNKFGLWSATGVSNQVIGGVATTFPTPVTPTPSGPTATPGVGTPTSTPTSTGGTPTPTHTPVSPQTVAAVGESSGAPGSRFIFTGSGFAPNTQLPVAVTSQETATAAGPLLLVGFVTTDANGRFTLTLLTEATLPAGRYRLTVGATQQATSEFEVNPTAPLRQPAIVGAVITAARQLYLPMVSR